MCLGIVCEFLHLRKDEQLAKVVPCGGIRKTSNSDFAQNGKTIVPLLSL